MKCLTRSQVDAAERFVWLSGRTIDRHRFAHLVRDGDREPVLAALRAYRNADGGFGHALEPDLRGPVSQPQPVEVALHVLDGVDAFDDPMVAGAIDYLATITTAEGGVPFVLPSARAYPRAPWWEAGDEPPASLNPTAAIAGLLVKHGVEHPWLATATDFCWRSIDSMEETSGYEARCVLHFLEHVPDRARAEAALDRLVALLTAPGLVATEPGQASEGPPLLEFVPAPGAMAARLFATELIDAHLDALVDAQDEDGGWSVDFPIWTPATGLEWRSVLTVETVHRLRRFGRWA
jgi:hypothetical protein